VRVQVPLRAPVITLTHCPSLELPHGNAIQVTGESAELFSPLVLTRTAEPVEEMSSFVPARHDMLCVKWLMSSSGRSHLSDYYFAVASNVGERDGISSQVRPASVRPPDFAVRPPHCLKKNGTPAATH
jgi:hypothetical protein